MKIKCPKCKEDAELAPDFSLVTCTKCKLEISYGEYVRYIAHSDAKYSDILGDYAGSTEGQTSGSLDKWD
jgi:ribosomal protein L37AE/L43A